MLRVEDALIYFARDLTAHCQIDVILQPVVVPFVRRRSVSLQQDNACAQLARLTMDYFRQNNVDVMDWLPYTADISPVEHVWGILERRVQRRPQPPTTGATR